MASSLISGQLLEWAIAGLSASSTANQSNVQFGVEQQGMHLLGLHLYDCHAQVQHAASESLDTFPPQLTRSCVWSNPVYVHRLASCDLSPYSSQELKAQHLEMA